jgi:hypothetical protein
VLQRTSQISSGFATDNRIYVRLFAPERDFTFEALRMVLAKAAGLSMISSAAGLAGGFALARAMVSLLYEVLYELRPADPMVYAAACAIVMPIGLAASLVPATRAARLDPVVTLKYE